MMAVRRGELAVEVEAAAGADAEELAQLTNRLRAELLGLDVDAVYSAWRGTVPIQPRRNTTGGHGPGGGASNLTSAGGRPSDG